MEGLSLESCRLFFVSISCFSLSLPTVAICSTTTFNHDGQGEARTSYVVEIMTLC